MKLVIITVPTIIDTDELKLAVKAFCETLDVPAVRVNVLEKADLEIPNASAEIAPILDAILTRCKSKDPLQCVSNFWYAVAKGEIKKEHLLLLTKHRIATQNYLKKNNSMCLMQIIDNALKMM